MVSPAFPAHYDGSLSSAGMLRNPWWGDRQYDAMLRLASGEYVTRVRIVCRRHGEETGRVCDVVVGEDIVAAGVLMFRYVMESAPGLLDGRTTRDQAPRGRSAPVRVAHGLIDPTFATVPADDPPRLWCSRCAGDPIALDLRAVQRTLKSARHAGDPRTVRV